MNQLNGNPGMRKKNNKKKHMEKLQGKQYTCRTTETNKGTIRHGKELENENGNRNKNKISK